MLAAYSLLLLLNSPTELPTTIAAEAAEPWFNGSYDHARVQLRRTADAVLDHPSPEQVEELVAALERIEHFDGELHDDGYGRELVLAGRILLAREWSGSDPDRAKQQLERAFAESDDPSAVVAAVATLSPELSATAEAMQPAVASPEPAAATSPKPVPTPGPAVSGNATTPNHATARDTATTPTATATENPATPEPDTASTSAPADTSEPNAALSGTDGEQLHEARTPRPKRERSSNRLLPLWAEATGVGVGGALLITGSALWSTDGKCRQLGQELQDCPRIWESTPAGAVTVSLGAALLITSTVLMVLDERRAPSRKHARRIQLQANGALRF